MAVAVAILMDHLAVVVAVEPVCVSCISLQCGIRCRHPCDFIQLGLAQALKHAALHLDALNS
jgi:hypothetical protein